MKKGSHRKRPTIVTGSTHRREELRRIAPPGSIRPMEEYLMQQNQQLIDHEALNRLEDRLKRGIPKWEQSHFIEQVVPLLVTRLKNYLKFENNS